MRIRAVRLYGENDLRLETVNLPGISEDEICIMVITDSINTQSLKIADQGRYLKKTSNSPIRIGHAFCGEILNVGRHWSQKFKSGEKYVVKANVQLFDKSNDQASSYTNIGGTATYLNIPKEVIEQGFLIPFIGETYFEGSLIEPLSCVIQAFETSYHIVQGTNQHVVGVKEGGNVLIMGGTSSMGLLTIDYALQDSMRPSHIVVLGTKEKELERTKALYPSQNGVQLTYVHVKDVENQVSTLKTIVNGGFDDILVITALDDVIECTLQLLNPDGCLNFCATADDKDWIEKVSFHDMQQADIHYVSTSSGNTRTMLRAAKLIEEKKVHVANVVTHVLGIDAVAKTVIHASELGGGEKIIYTGNRFDLINISKVDKDSRLSKILEGTNRIWNQEAEKHIIQNYRSIYEID